MVKNTLAKLEKLGGQKKKIINFKSYGNKNIYKKCR